MMKQVGEYFIDPYDLESESIDIMKTVPNWDELWERGCTSWYNEDENIWIFLFGGNGNCAISIEYCHDNGYWEELDHEMFAVCMADCFADICSAHLSWATKLLNKWNFK